MNPRITVITPSFNQGRFLEATIKSVLCQGYSNLEYMVFDGGSTDNSVEIIKRYESSLHCWQSETDKGQSDAINNGFAKSSGEILAWLNSDDTYEPNALVFVADFFSRHPEVDFMYGDVNVIDKGGNLIERHKELPFDVTMARCLGFGLIIRQPAAFWRRRVYEKLGGVREDLHFYMDGEYWRRIVAAGFKVQHVSTFLANARWHTDAKIVRNQLTHAVRHYEREFLPQFKKGYEELWVSRVVPFSVGRHVIKVYKVKRIIQRLVRGHYFSSRWMARMLFPVAARREMSQNMTSPDGER